MKRCTRCILPETFPGIEFDDEGVCQYCRHMPPPERRVQQRTDLRARFEQLVAEVQGESSYHGLMSWSGGKDSTYTLWLLRHEYNLRILAFTFDNGFISPAALDNMRNVSDNLGVDHVIIRPNFPFLQKAFAASTDPEMYPIRALERASGICNTCMGLAKGLAWRIALEKNIPMMVYGWSPGQIPLSSAFLRPNRKMLQTMVSAAAAPLARAANMPVTVYFPEARHFEAAPRMPVNVSPLAFIDWQEEKAVEVIQAYGWKHPKDTDPNSSNCLLNVFANQTHVRQWGYHPYAMELAGLVREGYMSREEALQRLAPPSSMELVERVEKRLGIPLSPSSDIH